MGLFYDEGVPGACSSNTRLALDYYHRAADYLPDSMHNIAKIFEDGRAPGDTDLARQENIKSAISLYSIAAARGFVLSQVNLGRLFLLGEESVDRDREAGKRLLVLAAESGDADAQMVLGMIHATTVNRIRLSLHSYVLITSDTLFTVGF